MLRADLILTLVFIVSASLVCATAAGPEENERQRRVELLKRHGIDADIPGLLAYLRGVQPDHADREEIATLVRQMDQADFAAREQAEHQLLAMGPVATRAALQDAAKNAATLEARTRAERLLEAFKSNDYVMLQAAVFTTVSEVKPAGAAPLLLKMLPALAAPVLQGAARDAVMDTAMSQDRDLLTATLAKGVASQRDAAVHALARLNGPEKNQPLYRYLTDADPRMCLATARALVNVGDRRGLATLAVLLDDADGTLRIEAATILRQSTGQQFGFDSGAELAERVEAVRRWRQWIKTEGPAARLVTPLSRTGRTVLRPSGLQYTVLRFGHGRRPGKTDKVVVHYRGTLADGTEFDSSYKRDKPLELALNQVIAGWTEGLQLMREGAKYRLVIPPQLGYGERGAGNLIPPNATLTFDVELIKVK